MLALHGAFNASFFVKECLWPQRVRSLEAKFHLEQKTYFTKMKENIIQLNMEIQLKNELLQKIARNQELIRDPINFSKKYSDWFAEHHQRILQLRRRLIGEFIEDGTLPIIENILSHFYSLFNMKKFAIKFDVFSITYGNWMCHTQRCIMWIGGLRPTDMLQLINNHIEVFGPKLEKMKFLTSEITNEEIALTGKFKNLEFTISNTLTENF
ncbi:transcription factor TGA1-like [Rutidosis leptorrhynchoides]|uniref:transcription factor TGA1-like n=1 Tax=Rutidosis leptorrhynchoides TaxID=125765 RepID=UPI003A9922D2